MLEMLKRVFTEKVDSTSEPGSLSKADLAKVTRDALISGVAAILAYLVQTLPTLDFQNWDGLKSTFLIPVLVWLSSFVMRFRRDNTVNVDVKN